MARVARVLLVTGILAAGMAFFIFRFGPCGSHGIQGLDVSHHQAPLDWRALRRQGIRFAYFKASEGSDWVDPRYREYEEAARAAGVLAGAYHFFTFCADPERQAMRFLATVDLRPGDMLPAVDVENAGNCLSDPDPESLRENLGKFRDVIRRATGQEPIVYMTDWFRRKYFRAPPDGARFWIRNLFWKPREGVPWAVWQYATNRPAGSPQRVDRDVLRGGEGALAALRYLPGNGRTR
jgi:lysozyme